MSVQDNSAIQTLPLEAPPAGVISCQEVHGNICFLANDLWAWSLIFTLVILRVRWADHFQDLQLILIQRLSLVSHILYVSIGNTRLHSQHMVILLKSSVFKCKLALHLNELLDLEFVLINLSLKNFLVVLLSLSTSNG
jgi:hypothetical protein